MRIMQLNVRATQGRHIQGLVLNKQINTVMNIVCPHVSHSLAPVLRDALIKGKCQMSLKEVGKSHGRFKCSLPL